MQTSKTADFAIHENALLPITVTGSNSVLHLNRTAVTAEEVVVLFSLI